jgi:hypothetical protein
VFGGGLHALGSVLPWKPQVEIVWVPMAEVVAVTV